MQEMHVSVDVTTGVGGITSYCIEYSSTYALTRISRVRRGFSVV